MLRNSTDISRFVSSIFSFSRNSVYSYWKAAHTR
uniref:Uncharacterized protein n=1 Tax=Pristionchus pacificus TaxID=54126 RepID=A0A2A6D1E3_PRIPA|eukprot:PDM84156.1 hypothetical protein PRIPAC_34348 [Pristionchus pacificus]